MTGRKRIVRVSSLSVAKVFGLIYGVVGLIASVLIGVMAMASGRNTDQLAVVLFLPILYAVGGFIGGLIFGGIYNVAAGVVGGIVIDLADEQPWE